MYEKMDDYSYACLDLLNDVCITLGKLAVECAKENEVKAMAVYALQDQIADFMLKLYENNKQNGGE